MRRALVLAIALLCACGERGRGPAPRASASAPAGVSDHPSFPALPGTPEAATTLVVRETKRSIDPAPAVDAARILAAIADKPAIAVAGETAIVRWIQERLDRTRGDAYVIAGSYHDSAGQIDAFRRLVGPAGLRGLTVVAVEQLRADGAWEGVPAEPQRGDGAAIDAYVAQGDPEAFTGLLRGHRQVDYAAWKLGYQDHVLDLLVNARATGVRFLGCDMPSALQERVLPAAVATNSLNRLREIHCLRSLPPTPGGRPRRAALLWGEAHLRADGLRRFLPREATVLALHLFGQRISQGEVEPDLARELTIDSPVLVPLGEEDAALLLPDDVMGGHVDRVLERAPEGEPLKPGLVVESSLGGVVSFGARGTPLTAEPTEILLPPGDHTYVLSAGGKRVIGALRVEPGHRLDLDFNPKARLTTYFEQMPR